MSRGVCVASRTRVLSLVLALQACQSRSSWASQCQPARGYSRCSTARPTLSCRRRGPCPCSMTTEWSPCWLPASRMAMSLGCCALAVCVLTWSGHGHYQIVEGFWSNNVCLLDMWCLRCFVRLHAVQRCELWGLVWRVKQCAHLPTRMPETRVCQCVLTKAQEHLQSCNTETCLSLMNSADQSHRC